jgi:hypothetical protein
MKIKSIFILSIVAVLYFGCDKVDAPYREEVVTPDFCATGIDDSIPNKKVLVEDYTGHTCGNCPDAGVYLNDSLKAIYNHCIVVVSVHAGFFAPVCPGGLSCPTNAPSGSFSTDFTTAAGNAWNTFFHITGNPKGMVDRIGFPGNTHSKGFTAWSGAIASELTKNAKAKISIANTYSQSNNSVGVSVSSEFLENITGDHKLQVIITEDSVIDWQVWYNHTPVDDSTYVHHHVMRASLNGDWGDLVASGNTTAGTQVTKSYNFTIPSNVLNVDHCNIVAFIYDDTTKEVLQVEEAPVK